ncbi:MAG: hypothetical protein ACYC54_13045 [Sedimentisphaerales bacterium]
MHLLDWLILTDFAIFISVMAYSARKYSNRCAGKYLVAMGDGLKRVLLDSTWMSLNQTIVEVIS